MTKLNNEKKSKYYIGSPTNLYLCEFSSCYSQFVYLKKKWLTNK